MANINNRKNLELQQDRLTKKQERLKPGTPEYRNVQYHLKGVEDALDALPEEAPPASGPAVSASSTAADDEPKE